MIALMHNWESINVPRRTYGGYKIGSEWAQLW